MTEKTARAQKAFEEFSGHRPQKVRKSRLPDNDVVGWQMGPAVGIAYEAKRDNQTRQYFHEFSKKARPNLVASDDGKQLYIDGGRYKVTDRGIEDMPQLFVVNPSPRKGRSKRKAPMAKRRRTATRRRATRQVAVFRANPIRRRRRRASPARARRRTYRANPVARRNPVRRRRASVRRFRRNPSVRRMGGGALNFGKMLLPAAGIGAGAVGSELIMGYLPIPAAWKQGVMRHVTKAGVGIAAGYLIGKVLKQKRIGSYFMLGAVAIATHDLIKEVLSARMAGLQFGQYVRPLRNQFGGMGYISPAQVTRTPALSQYVAPLAPAFGGSSQAYDATAVRGAGESDFRA